MTNNYSKQYPRLLKVAKELEKEIGKYFEKKHYVDQIKVRVKSVQSFSQKARRKVHRRLKYHNALKEIEDQIGIRIVVRYKTNVPEARKILQRYYCATENLRRENSSPHHFGYEGHVLVLPLPQKIQQRHKIEIEFFEVQICTLFQHAWAEAEHDIGYKPENRKPTKTERKKLAWLAASAWGADELFKELRR